MKQLAYILVFVCCSGRLFAVLPPLEREVNIQFVNEPVSSALLKIQDQTGLIFSYKASIISGLGPVSMNLRHKTVREALALILPATITFKPKNNYIILKEKPGEKNPKKTEISGYVYDKTTEKKVPNVTIYDKESLQSATTDEYGYYSISVPAGKEKISVNKENYKDTTIVLSAANESKLNNIVINRLNDSVHGKDSSLWENTLKNLGMYSEKMRTKFRGFVNTINVRDTLNRAVQVSLFPFVGTNHKLSGNVVNRLSFNVYGGFAKGVTGFELGGLFNIDKENVKGVQIAGLFNVVGDTVSGTQIAGLFNVTGKAVRGFQASALMNINEGSQTGGQVAALMNINNRSSKGASVAGLMNITNCAKGAQVATLLNINDTLKGVGIAGIGNITEHGDGAVQIAYLFNSVDHGTAHLQIAGLFNSASYVSGVQIAPLNFADSASGLPIGLFSVVKKGLHQIELGADELCRANFSFRTGVYGFHNILTIGFQPGDHNRLWQFGYGVGTSLKVSKKFRTELALTAHHLSRGSFYFGTSELFRIYTGFEFKVSKRFSVAMGPTVNFYVSDALVPDYEIYKNIAPYSFMNTTTPYDFNWKGWVGGKFSLRFL